MKKLSFLAMVLVCAAFSTQGFGQATNATVSGTAEDSTHAVLPGVTISVTNTATGVMSTAITNESGAYNVPGLLPVCGVYALSAPLQMRRPARSYCRIRFRQRGVRSVNAS